jgi:large repetitive protein
VEKHVQNALDGVRGTATSIRRLRTRGILGGLALRRTALTYLTTLALALALVAGAQAAGASYVYDEMGRLIQLIASDGTSTQYMYDLAGNILAVRADATTTLAITAFYPETGAVASTVTMTGSGFSTVAANNTVKFNGVVARVIAATAVQLAVTVSAGATAGSISVANANGTVASTRVFTVGLGDAPAFSGARKDRLPTFSL